MPDREDNESLTPDPSESGLPQPDQSPAKGASWVRRLGLLGLGITAGLGLVTVGIGLGGRSYVRNQILPQVETSLEDILQRDVTLGDVRFVLPWQITVGESEIEHLATVRTIDIEANVWAWLRHQELKVDVQLNNPNVVLMETLDRGWFDLDLNLEGGTGSLPVSDLTVTLRGGEVTVMPLQQNSHVLERLNGRIHLPLAQVDEQPVDIDLRAVLEEAPIEVTGGVSGLADGEDVLAQLQVEGESVPITVLELLPITPFFQPFDGTADVDLAVEWQPGTPVSLLGAADVENVAFALEVVPLPFENVTGRVEIADDRTVRLTDIEAQFGQLPFQVAGTLDWPEAIALGRPGWLEGAEFNLAGQADELTLAQLLETFPIPLPFPVEGRFKGDAQLIGPLTNPQLVGQFQEIAPATIDQLSVETLGGDFVLAGNQLRFDNLTAQLPQGLGSMQGSGTVQLANGPTAEFPFQLLSVNPNAIVNDYQLPAPPKTFGTIGASGTLSITPADTTITANWQASGGEIEGTGQLRYLDNTILIEDSTLALAGGTSLFSATIAAPDPTRGDRAFSARAVPESPIQLSFFVPNTTGTALGDVIIDGWISELNLGAIAIRGRGELPEGFNQLPGPMSGEIDWNGSVLSITNGQVLNAIAVSGDIPFNATTQEIGPLNLALTTENYPLSSFPQVPATLPVEGLLSLNGRLQGTLEALRLVGDVGLQNLQMAGLAFSPLVGTLDWQPGISGVSLDLLGTATSADVPPDRIAVELDANLAPQTFAIQHGTTEARGLRTDNRFDVSLQAFPVSLLNGFIPGGWAGKLDSRLTVYLAEQVVTGSANAENLRWRGIRTNQLQGSFDYRNGQLQITDGQLGLQESLYSFGGWMRLPTPDQIALAQQSPDAGIPLQMDLNLATENGTVESILTALQWEEWGDVTTGLPTLTAVPASELEVEGLNIVPRDLYDQIEAYSAIVSQQQAALANTVQSRLPDLSRLTGAFQGQVRISGALPNPAVNFNLTGQDWRLDPFHLETLAANGILQNGILTLQEFNGQTGGRSGSLRGVFGGDAQQAYFNVDRFPLHLLNGFFPDGPEFLGTITANAEITGSIANPEGSGQFRLNRVRINDRAIEAAGGEFDYRQGMLNVDGEIVTTAPEPVEVVGRLPLALPFATAKPVSDELTFQVLARDEQLGLINLLTDAVSWQSGLGLLDVRIGGTLREPTLSGQLNLENAVVGLAGLDEPLQQLNAEIAFNSSQLDVQSFSGTFSNGLLTADGLFAINPNGVLEEGESPLTAQMQNLRVDIPNLYKGDIDGETVFTGVLLEPVIGGRLVLEDGNIDVLGGGSSDSEERAWEPRFNNLEVVLGDGVHVAQTPLFSFRAVGSILLNGSASAMRPEGTVNIEQGYFNLGITNLRIDRGRENTVVFQPGNGMDPLLDVGVFTEVQEVQGTSVTRSLGSDSATAQTFAQQGTVLVRANIRGRASDLARVDAADRNIIELTSSPSRDPDEIVALLGGASLGAVGNGGLAGFALSTLLYGASNALGNAVGLDELQVTTFSGESGSLEVGLEAAKDLGAGVSVSVQQSLSDPDQATRFSTRYRINDRIILRAGTDFEENDQISIEFQTRF